MQKVVGNHSFSMTTILPESFQEKMTTSKVVKGGIVSSEGSHKDVMFLMALSLFYNDLFT